jgi:hypothetical protein
VEVKEQYQIKILNRFAALENLVVVVVVMMTTTMMTMMTMTTMISVGLGKVLERI